MSNVRLNLKRALKVKKALDALLAKGVDLPKARVDYLVLQDGAAIDAALNKIRDKALASQQQYVAASDALARLRAEIATKNVSSGIDSLLARIADADRRIKITSAWNDNALRMQSAIFNAEASMFQRENADGKASVYSRTATTGILTAEDIAQAQAELAVLRRFREELDDQRAALNASTFIEIAEVDAKVLQDMGIL